MSVRIASAITVSFAVFCCATGPAGAQAPKPDYERLKSILEEKFAPPEQRRQPATRSLTSPPLESAAPAPPPPAVATPAAVAPVEAAPKEIQQEKYEWVKPAPGTGKTPGQQSSPSTTEKTGSWVGDFIDGVKRRIWSDGPSSSLSPFRTYFIGADLVGLGKSTTDTNDRSLLVRTGGGATNGTAPAVPVAKKNSYMIQFKADATEEQIAEILQKHNLNVVKVIGALGVVMVEQEVVAEEPTRGVSDSSTGGTGAGGPLESVTDPKERLERILEPPLIKALRKESAVDAAFVNSLIGNKTLRTASGATIKSGDNTYSWRWHEGETQDGNWGLKAIRMPPVWNLIERHRRANPDAPRPKIGIIDVGFTQHALLDYDVAIGALRSPLVRPDCETNHGTHVAGIIGAKRGATLGIDGMMPGAKMEAVSIAAEFIGERDRLGADQNWQAQAMLFSDVLASTMIYLTDNLRQGDNLRVVNVSLAYNFVARGVLGDTDPDSVSGLKLHIAEQASVIRTMARLVENEVLFVVAAGNDSEGRDVPLDTRWASPFAWAGTYKWTSGEPVRNIIVVEAFDRDRSRALFSNVGGHVSAPGVDIMSTLGGTTAPFAVCSGTSQAAPHVTALAAILFELDPAKTPADIIAALRDAAAPASGPSEGAPRVNALASAMAVSDTAARLITDLNGDGKVDEADVRLFAAQLGAIEAAAVTEAAFTEDLNGDGVIDDNECFYPLIDFNGDGEASMRAAKAPSSPGLASDVALIEQAWSGSSDALRLAMNENGLSARIAHALVASRDADPSPPPSQCRRRDTSLVVAGLPPVDPPSHPADPAPESTRTETSTEGTVVSGDISSDTSTSGTAAGSPDADIGAEVARGVEVLKELNPDLRIVINPATGLPSSISGFKPDAASLAAGARAIGEPTEEDTRRIVESFLSTSGLSAALPTRNRQAELRYTGRRKDPDIPGRFVANVEQRVGNVKVFGSSARLTVENSLGVTRFQGTLSSVAVSDTVPTVTEEDAIARARGKLAEMMRGSPSAPAPPLQMGPNPETAPATGELVVFDPVLLRARIKGGARLAWMITVDSFRIFVDAKTGEVFHSYRDKPTALIRRVFDLASPDKAAVVDEDGPAQASSIPRDAEQAFRYSGIVRDYFYLNFGRNSFDDNDEDGPNGGAPLESFVRYGNVRNAFWCPFKSYDCPRPNVMVFGPGYAGAVDIVAHEMVHGIIQHEANLIYSDEPGAVNEAIADIFAVLIEFYARSGRGNWLIGEDAPGFSMERPLRSLAHPNLTDEAGTASFDPTARFSSVNRGQPSHYGEVVRPDDPICASTWLNDNGCVHFNSGIINKFAHLIAEGGEHRGTIVTGIGLEKLGRLTYRTLTTQLNQSSDLMETAEGFLQSCLDLSFRNVGGFTESDCDSVMAAQQAVGLVFGS